MLVTDALHNCHLTVKRQHEGKSHQHNEILPFKFSSLYSNQHDVVNIIFKIKPQLISSNNTRMFAS